MVVFLEGSEWQTRRVIYTREIVAFAYAGDDIMIDSILLTEVESVRVMERGEQELDFSSRQQTRKDEDGPYTNALVIKTLPDGHNTGRSYYLRATSLELCKEVAAILHRAAKKAKFRAVAKTSFAKSQFWIRKIYDSAVFTQISASLIIAVLALKAAVRRPQSATTTRTRASMNAQKRTIASFIPTHASRLAPYREELSPIVESDGIRGQRKSSDLRIRKRFRSEIGGAECHNMFCARSDTVSANERVCMYTHIPQNFLLCVFDAQYERDLQLSNGSQTHLGQLDDMMNAVG